MMKLWTLQVIGILVATLACFTGAVSTPAGDLTTEVNDMKTEVTDMTTEMDLTTVIELTTDIELTTEVDLTTTASSEVTTSAPEARWSVKDKDGKLCMLMDFSGTIGLIDNKNETYEIPPFASTDRSKCSSSFATFTLKFSPWSIELNFTTRRGSYQLHNIWVSKSEGGQFVSFSKTQDFFDVPLGHYYTCKNFKQTIGLFELNLIKPSFQPFVQKTKGGDNLGKAHECRPGSNGRLAVGIIIAVIVIIVALAAMWYVVKRRRSPSNNPYSRVPVQAAI